MQTSIIQGSKVSQATVSYKYLLKQKGFSKSLLILLILVTYQKSSLKHSSSCLKPNSTHLLNFISSTLFSSLSCSSCFPNHTCAFIYSKSSDIFAVTETWLTDTGTELGLNLGKPDLGISGPKGGNLEGDSAYS